jgi:predicted Rossmann fold nucleotide-binding protein DprA/Smf involved in DNA uptake
VAQAIHTRQPMSAAAKELAQAQEAGIRLLTWDEPEYPQRLREIYDPPHPSCMSAETLDFCIVI